MRVKCVCKSCIREHSDKHVLDHNRNLQSPIRITQIFHIRLNFAKNRIKTGFLFIDLLCA